MKPGTMVTTERLVHLDPVEAYSNDKDTWENIVKYDIKDIPFRPGEIGLVLNCRKTLIANRSFWVTVLTPSGVGVCFSDELEVVKAKK